MAIEQEARERQVMEVKLSNRGAFQILASAFVHVSDCSSAQKILGDLALEIFKTVRSPMLAKFGEMQEWEVRIKPINERFETWWYPRPEAASSSVERQDGKQSVSPDTAELSAKVSTPPASRKHYTSFEAWFEDRPKNPYSSISLAKEAWDYLRREALTESSVEREREGRPKPQQNASLLDECLEMRAVVERFVNHGHCPNCGCDQWNTAGCPTCPTMRSAYDLLASAGLKEPRKYAEYLEPDEVNRRNMAANAPDPNANTGPTYDALQAERDQLRTALEEIAGFMRKEAEEKGCKIDGQWAVKLSESANYLKGIASRALRDRAYLSESGSVAKS